MAKKDRNYYKQLKYEKKYNKWKVKYYFIKKIKNEDDPIIK